MARKAAPAPMARCPGCGNRERLQPSGRCWKCTHKQRVQKVGRNLAIPGRMGISHTLHPGELANQSALIIQEQGGAHIHTFGGLTKREVVALHLIGARGLPRIQSQEGTDSLRAALSDAEYICAVFEAFKVDEQRAMQEAAAEQAAADGNPNEASKILVTE